MSAIHTQPNAKYPVKNLSYVVSKGGRLRRHRYLGELRAFAWPMLIAAACVVAIYVFTITRSGRSDWQNILTAAAILALVPAFSSAILAGLRQHTSAIISAIIVTLGLFLAAVSFLAGLRLPVSFQGILFCLPALLLIMAYANARFQRTIRMHVGLANFEGADAVSEELGGITILPPNIEALTDIEILLIDPLSHHSKEWSDVLSTCYLRGIEIMTWTTYRELLLGRLDVSTFEISHLVYTPSQLAYARMKRAFDILGVLVTLPITIPAAILVALYIGLRDGFPVFFIQNRRGYGGKQFRMFKFRTMYKGTEGGSTTLGDNRIIPGGHILRKLRLDELPQLYNILRGDMSLIGPRPVAEYVAQSSAELEPKFELRTLVLPGITGWAQVRSGYAATPEQEIEKLSYDLYYIKRLSLDLDLLILFKTVRTVLFGIGAR